MTETTTMYRVTTGWRVKLEAFTVFSVTAKTVYFLDYYGYKGRQLRRSNDHKWFTDLDDARVFSHEKIADKIEHHTDLIKVLQEAGVTVNEEPTNMSRNKDD